MIFKQKRNLADELVFALCDYSARARAAEVEAEKQASWYLEADEENARLMEKLDQVAKENRALRSKLEAAITKPPMIPEIIKVGGTE